MFFPTIHVWKLYPTWLATPGPVFLKRHVRTNKMEPLVDEVELLGANPNYVHICYPDGRTTTVSIKHLAPCGEPLVPQESPQPLEVESESQSSLQIELSLRTTLYLLNRNRSHRKCLTKDHVVPLRCSTRIRLPRLIHLLSY